MPRKPLDDDIYVPNGLHYNVKYIAGVLVCRVTERYFQVMRPTAVEWVWICELGRHATAAEINKLCRGK